jgi:hypothetical protein
MGRKSHYLMERVYAYLSKNGCRKSGLLTDPELTVTLLVDERSEKAKPGRYVVDILTFSSENQPGAKCYVNDVTI